MAFQIPRMSYGMFAAEEFAKIADMQGEHLRVWRNRGHIGSGKGRGASYPSNELAETMFRNDLARYGMPPSESAEIGHECADKILRLVLFNHAHACEVRGPKSAVEWLIDLHQNSDTLAQFIYGAEVGDELLVRLDGGAIEYVPSEDARLNERNYRCALLLNLEGYAERLVALADRPILIFSFDRRDDEEEVRSTLANG